jgi:uncharacterized protein (TIGR00730 family)
LKHISETVDTPRKPSRKSRTKAAAAPENGAATAPQRTLRNICVYCGSGVGKDPIYAETARILGRALASNGVGLVYGGGGLGLMGEVARATLEAGGRVTGIIPEFLTAREHMLKEVTDLVVTQDMHQRKRLMYEKSDAFVALPGGIGTLEELVEQLTWAQLGQHNKPIVLANVADFWSPFLSLLNHMREEAFIRASLEVRYGVVTDAHEIVPRVQRLFAESEGESKPATLIKF